MHRTVWAYDDPPPAVSIIAIAVLSVGCVSALVIYCNYLCDFNHVQLVAIISFVSLISLFVTCFFILANISLGSCIVASAALSCLGITICCRIANRTPLFHISADESEQRATTRNIDRFTYCLIGINFGFSYGFIVFTASELQAASVVSTSTEALALLIPALLASILLLFFRNQHQYVVEHLSKDYLSASVVTCLIIAVVSQGDIRLVAVGVIMFLASSQMLIAVNASIEFIRCENLSPIWYLAEDGFIVLGFSIGLGFSWWASGFNLSADGFTYACFAIAIINVCLQPQINKGRYPLLVSQSSPVIRAQAAQSSGKSAVLEQENGSEENTDFRKSCPTEKNAKSERENDELIAGKAQGRGFKQHVDTRDEANRTPNPQSNAQTLLDKNPSNRNSVIAQSIVHSNFDESRGTAKDDHGQPQSADDAGGTPSTDHISAGDHRKGSFQKKIDYISNERNLSPRQHQILGYLARGRDARFIEEKFCISHSTAKSHIYNIYGKLDVHSKQELIDLIEHTQVPHYKDDPE